MSDSALSREIFELQKKRVSDAGDTTATGLIIVLVSLAVLVVVVTAVSALLYGWWSVAVFGAAASVAGLMFGGGMTAAGCRERPQ